MAEEFKKYSCKYTAEWPVDKFGRLGGMYSSTDLPITGYVKMEREGTLVSQDSKRELYEIRDGQRQFVKRVVKFNKVTDIMEVPNE
tara:strand:+ start:40 stop:297 length:258 start_codon:yes stop_codon:yes gene_type:complete